MPRPRRNYEIERDSFSSELSDVDYIPILELANAYRRKRSNRAPTKRRGAMKKASPPKVPRDINNSVIVLDDSDDDCLSTVISRSRTINDNVKNKVDDIFKSSGLLSDDEDELLMNSNIINKNKSDDMLVSTNINEPGSSTHWESIAESTSRERIIVVEDDVNEINTVEDIKNYCKETEDILKNANAILEKFSGTTSQAEQHSEKEVLNNKENSHQEKKLECPICYENLSEKQVMTTKCGHLFCRPCIETVVKTIKKCPTCRKAVNKKNIIPIYI